MTDQTSAVVPLERQPRSVLVDMSVRYGMEPAAFEQTVRATVCKGQVSREEFAAFLLVAKEYRLNPLTKEIYAFPAKGGGIQPIVSIDGWARIINERPELDGIEFDDHLDASGAITAITARIWRKDRRLPIVVTEYMSECRRSTDVWKQWPARMLRHKSMIQCARYAFGFSGIVDPDEYERMTEARDVTPATTGMRARLEARQTADAPGFNADHIARETGAQPAHDPETGEIVDAQVEPIDPPAEDPLPVRDDTAADFPGDKPSEPAKPPLAERIAAFKTRCEAATGTVKLQSLWAASSELRSDLDASDPDALVELTGWFNARFDAVEAVEKGR